MSSSSQGRPRDGPATSFEADAKVTILLDVKNSANAIEPDEFGLVLAAGWPPTEQMTVPYDKLLSLIRRCFDANDLAGDYPAVYLYPPSCLHVTVAIFHSIAQNTRNTQERILLETQWKSILAGALSRPEWPTKPMELVLESAQIGIRAGILLWTETTGRLEQMRRCIRAETSERKTELKAAGVNVETLAIPSIVHSTFLRFHAVPKTSGETVQSRFQTLVTPRLNEIFSSPIVVKDARFVNESSPYMHIPNDERHVYQTFSFQNDN